MPPIFTTTATSSPAARTWLLEAKEKTASATMAVELIRICIGCNSGGSRFSALEKHSAEIPKLARSTAAPAGNPPGQIRCGGLGRGSAAGGSEFRPFKSTSSLGYSRKALQIDILSKWFSPNSDSGNLLFG